MDNWSKLVVGSTVKFIGDANVASQSGFTKGKKYEVYARSEHGFTLLDDAGHMVGFLKQALGYTFKFKPKNFKVGDHVVWTGESNVGHTKGKTYEVMPSPHTNNGELYVTTDKLMFGVFLVYSDSGWKLADYPLAKCEVGDLISSKLDDEDDTSTPEFIKDKPYTILAKNKRWLTVIGEGGWELYIHRKNYNWYPVTEAKVAPHAGTPIEVLQKLVYLGKEKELTTGKVYQVAEVKRDKFAVVNNKGLNVWFSGTNVEDVANFFEVCKPVSEIQLRKDDLVLCVSASHCELLTPDNVYKVVRVDASTYDVQEPTTGAVIANLPLATFSNFFLALNISNKKELITLITSRPESSTTKAAKRVQRPVGSIDGAKVGDYVKYLGGEEAIYGTAIKENAFYKVLQVSPKFVYINVGGNTLDIPLNRNASQWQLMTRQEMELNLQKAVIQQIDDNLKIAYRLSNDEEECLSDDEVEKSTLFIWWHKDKGIRVSEDFPGDSLVNKKALPIFGEMIPMMLEGVEMGHLVEMHYNGKIMEVEVYNCDEDHDSMDDDCDNNDWDEDEAPCGSSACNNCSCKD